MRQPKYSISFPKSPYYEYIVDIGTYQLREEPRVLEYQRRYRSTFRTCLRKCHNTWMEKNRRAEVRRGSHIMLYIPKVHVRGFMLMTPTGIIQEYGYYDYRIPKYPWLRQEAFVIILTGCLNRAFELDMPYVKFRVSVEDYWFNKRLEKYWETLGCSISVRIGT